jgi:hypothetical protein
MKASVINDVIVAVVTALDSAVSYQVFDGPPSKRPVRGTAQYLVIGAEALDDEQGAESAASMEQTWQGLGEIMRMEELDILCVAVGRASSIAQARSLAMGIIEDVMTNLPRHPTNESFNCLISSVGSVKVNNTAGGAVVHVEFTISASARLT